jgi:N-acyl-D-aspartate/D-glutamate deacylase
VAYDLVIRNGMLVDGSGLPPYRADVGLSGERIAAIGRIGERGGQEIDAEGHIVSPGFVEIHTHMDAQVFWDPLGTCSSWHGVTSAVMGNCGFTLAPCREAEKDLVMRNLERAEDISREAMLAGIEWQWETYPEYLDAVDRVPKGINYGGYVGHSALRTYVMGERAFDERATDEDLSAMRRAVADSIRAGALGFTTSRSANHMTSDNRPVASRAAGWDEVRALVGVMGELGAGIFETANEVCPSEESRLDYWGRLRDLAADTGRPMTFVIGYAPSNPELWRQYLGLLDDSAMVGGRMIGQVHSREFLSLVGFKVKLPFDGLPSWREVRGLPLDTQRAALADPTTRARLVDEALHGPYGTAIGAEARAPSYDILRVLDSADGPWRTVAEVAAERGTTPVDAMIDLSLAADFDLLFAQPFANQDPDVVLAMIRHPRTVIGVSDSGAHVSQIIDSSIPTYLLAHWVRETGALRWEEAVRMLTFDPAAAWGIRDRGLLHEGFAGDIVVFDPERIGPGLPHPASDLPAGAKRLTQKATGILATVVNGQVFMRGGEPTGALAGRLLRGPLASASRPSAGPPGVR